MEKHNQQQPIHIDGGINTTNNNQFTLMEIDELVPKGKVAINTNQFIYMEVYEWGNTTNTKQSTLLENE